MRFALFALLALAAPALIAQGPPPGRGARFLGAEARRSGRTVPNAPYSADVVTESVQVLPNGNRVRQTTNGKIYRDSAGRTRREQAVNLDGLSPDSKMPRLIFITDPVAGFNYALNASERTGTRSVRAAWGSGPNGRGGREGGGQPAGQPGGPRRNGGNQSVKLETLGHQTIEGLEVEGRRTTMTVLPGQAGNEQPIQIVAETWYSADLQISLLSKRSDPRHGETITRLIHVVRGEPDRSLFEVPAGYKIADASAVSSRSRVPVE
jgi:hypothetical protein